MNTRLPAQRDAARDALVESDLVAEYQLDNPTLDRVVQRVVWGATPEDLADYLDTGEQIGIAGDPWTVKTAAKVIAAVRGVS